jgi:hypothetical protein
MDQCKYVYIRGIRKGEQCINTASINGFCSGCWMNPNAKLQLEQGYIKPWVNPKENTDEIVIDTDPVTGLSITDTSKLKYVCTLSELCKRVPVKDLLLATENCCRHMNMKDFSLDLTAAAKFISQLSPRFPECGFECNICVITKYGVRCKFGPFSIAVHQIGSWDVVASSIVNKNPILTDAEALATIIWDLTCKGWDEEYLQWLGIIEDMTRDKCVELIKQKLEL